MALCMLNYYIFKDSLESLDKQVIEKMEYDDDLLFNLSTFNDLGLFFKLFNPFKKDKYQIYKKIYNNDFYKFILECIGIAKANNNYQQLLFIYAMCSSFILKKNFDSFIKDKLSRRLSYDKACNMIDYYYAMSKDNLDLTKIKLSKHFKNSFIYHNYMEDLIHNPLIKIYKFFCSKRYFTHSMVMKGYYYSSCTTSKFKLKYIPYFIYDILFNHLGKPKACSYIYNKRIKTSILNLAKKEYVVDDIVYNYSIEDIYNNSLNEIKAWYKAINQFIFFSDEKAIRKIFNIDKEEKI